MFECYECDAELIEDGDERRCPECDEVRAFLDGDSLGYFWVESSHA